MKTAKTTAYGHPRLPSSDGRRYFRMSRRDAAAALREAKSRRGLDRTRGSHGQMIYTISRERYVELEIHMTLNRRIQED